MVQPLDDRLTALGAAQFDMSLDGLEADVWRRAEALRARSNVGSARVRVGLALAALAFGLVMGAQGHLHPRATEMGVLSEDGLLAPSMRLGGA